ncbi:MAG: mandelate racemase [marine bacterium B5-7]|nr:MAG: mandelate racemase [marine bacterium B5-7]
MTELKIESINVKSVNVPMARPLVTGGGSVTSAPLVLINMEAGGIEGSSYIFCYSPAALSAMSELVQHIAESLKSQAALPNEVFYALRKRFRLLGNQGLVAMACAGIDMALWDIAAKNAGLPLCRLLGAESKSLPAYNSNGLGIIGPAAASNEARELLHSGFGAIKLRLGYPSASEDLAVVKAVHESVGNDILLMIDYNQCLSVTDAKQRMRLLDDTGIYWLEEPTLAEDYSGHHQIRQHCKTAVQIGENCWGPGDMKRALDAGACDYFMADVAKIGGVSGWLQAATLGENYGIRLSSHLYPEISAHLLSATPTAHWLEYVDWAEPILDSSVPPGNGMATPSEIPGNGIVFNSKAIKKYTV